MPRGRVSRASPLSAMIFAIKKILDPFLLPLGFFLCVAAAGILLLALGKKKAGIIATVLAVVLLAAASSGPVSRLLLDPLESKYQPYPAHGGAKVDFVVVLGGGHVSDPDLPVPSFLSGQALQRLVEGIRVFRANPGSKLVFSGAGVSDPLPEAVVMARVARTLGVNSSDILLDIQSTDTKDHTVFVKNIVKSRSFAVVTSAFHMPRAMAMFTKARMSPVPAPAGHLSKASGKTWFSWVPNVEALYGSHKAMHEYVGLAWAKLAGQV